MVSLLFKRLFQSFITVMIAMTLVFFLFNVIPGTFASSLMGDKRSIDSKVVERVVKELGIDRPIHQRFGSYVAGLFRGDLGKSFSNRRPVVDLLKSRIIASVKLACAAILCAIVIGLPLGFIAAIRAGGVVDTVTMMFAVSGLSVPGFWFGLIAMYLFSIKLGLLPTFGYGDGGVRNLILPALTLGIAPMALLARTTRAAVLETLNSDFIRTARSKGMSETRIVVKHLGRNAFVIILTTIGLQFGSMLGGSVVIEKLFAWPGIGSMLVDSVSLRDIPSVQGCILVIVLFFLIINTLVDIAYMVIDPRIRYQ